MEEPVRAQAPGPFDATLACNRCQIQLAPGTNFCPRCGADLRGIGATSDTFRGFIPGKVIDGRYRLLERLGEGGMGAVYKVEHVRMGKAMALKLLKGDLAFEPRALARFRDEARIVSKLSHPNTISVFDFGELEDGSLYIAMEYVSGQDLASVLKAEGKLPERRAAQIGIQVLRSLGEAHDAGIVHRDIKPGNVMAIRTRQGEDWVKVLDFGIAKLAEAKGQRPPGREHITGVAEFVGTPNYCSPEQAKGEELDARSDLYSLGAVLFELATGRGPYEAPTPMGVVTKHLLEPIPSVRDVAPEVSEGFEAVVCTALAKSPEERFRNADEMRAALEQAVGGTVRTFSLPESPITGGLSVARREDWDAFERSLARRTAMRAWLGGLLIASIFAAVGLFAYRRITAPVASAPVTEEREINDDPQTANLIALEAPVTGSIGVSHKPGKSDIDTFLLPVDRPGALWVSLTGIPDLNLVLEIFDADRESRRDEADPFTHVVVDDGRLGEGELLGPYPVSPGRYYLRISERPAYDEPDPNRPPRERESARYSLRASEVSRAPFDEVEPNDTPSVAQRVGFTSPVLGHAGAPVPPHAIEKGLVLAAFDYFRASAPPGTSAYALVVQPPGRRLGALDMAAIARWKEAAAAFVAQKAEREKRGREAHERRLAASFLAPPARADAAGVIAVRLEPRDGQVGVLVEPLAGGPPTQDDPPYGLAFVHEGPGGLTAALSLADALVSANRPADAKALLDALVAAVASSPDLPEARAQRQAIP